MYAETGVSTRIPFRKTFSSVMDLNRDINKYKSYSNVYHSIYWFRELEQKFDYQTGKFHDGPNYESAIINKIVLDIDAYEKTILQDGRKLESYTSNAIKDIRLLAEWGESKDVLREYRFSGGGFYFIFSALGHPLKLRDYEINLGQEVGINIDESTIGDTSRLIRVINSYNFKDHRKCFSIPLREEELYLPYEKIKELAQKPRYNERFIYGSETINFEHCKIDKEKIKLKQMKIDISQAKQMDANEILYNYGWEVKDFCDSIKGILSLNHKGNFLRFELIKYLKTIVKLSFEDNVRVMVALLGGEGVHSAVEGQAKHVYSRNKQFNPEWKLKPLGYCDNNCDICYKYKKSLWDVENA